MIALVTLPDHSIPTDGVFTNLHGWWKPPQVVTEFWATGCKIEAEPEDIERVKEAVLALYDKSIAEFHRMNAL